MKSDIVFTINIIDKFTKYINIAAEQCEMAAYKFWEKIFKKLEQGYYGNVEC